MALRGASRAQLLKAGRLHFAEVFSDPLFDGRHPDPGKTVIGYRGDHGALVKDAAGRKLLLKSTLPLQARTAYGELAPVDLSLRESTQTFTTANSNADVQIFKDPARGISFLEEGFSVSDVTAAGGAQPDGVQADGRVFFDDAAGGDSDVSFIVVPKPSGVEVGWLLATADASEAYKLKLDLPAGARVRRTQTDDPIPGDPPRTFEIVDRDGRSLAYITPPMTVDSDGVNVESSMRIVGRDRLVVDVKHHGEDLRYPLFVDPELLVPRGRSAADWQGWGTYQEPATPNRVAADYNHNYYGWALDHPAYYPNGAYMSMLTKTYYDMNTRRAFEYKAPLDTYVSFVAFGNIAHWAIWPTGTYSMWYQGILNSTRNAWSHVWTGHRSTAAVTHVFGGGSGSQNYAHIGLTATAPNAPPYLWTGSLSSWVTMDYANVYLGDDYPPVLTSAPPANQDWSNATSRTRTVSASDRGTKLIAFKLTGPGIDTTTPYSHGEPQDIQYTPAEGSHEYTLTAIDAVEKPSTPHTWTEKIDRSGPDLYVEGSLYDLRSQDYAEGGTYDLSVSAEDQPPTSSPGIATSGVKSIEIKVGGARRFFVDQQCPPAGGCDLESDDFAFKPTGLSGSVHAEVIATDFANNQTTVPWDFTVVSGTPTSGDHTPRATPEPTGPGPGCMPALRLATDRQPPTSIVNAIRASGYETTAFYADGSYRIARCNSSGALTIGQTVEKLLMPGNELVALVTHESKPAPGFESAPPVDATTQYDTWIAEYPPADTPGLAELWNQARDTMLARVLPATTI